jgi:hypothetical protein
VEPDLIRLVSLSEYNSALAERLTHRLVDRIITDAGLDVRHREKAIAETEFEVLIYPTDIEGFYINLPFCAGLPGWDGWDGSEVAAEQMTDAAAETAVIQILSDRERHGPTGWEARGLVAHLPRQTYADLGNKCLMVGSSASAIARCPAGVGWKAAGLGSIKSE